MDLGDLWHFPRPDLAESYFHLLTLGPVSQTTIFAPRRTGKTRFLLRDLLPLAQAKGFAVAYADLWQTEDPGLALVRGLEEAAAHKGLASRAVAALTAPVKRVKGKAGNAAVSGELEVEFGTQAKPAEADAGLRIDQLIAGLTRRKSLLLLVDEAQGLAQHAVGEQLARSLRTALTKHAKKTRVVFTGSSRTLLSRVFSSSTAPLYSAGNAVHDFPVLGEDFVRFLCEKFGASTGGRKLDARKALAAHERFGFRPEALVNCVVAMVMQPGLSIEQAEGQVRADLSRREAHGALWQQIDPLQQRLLLLLSARPELQPYAKATLAELSEGVGAKIQLAQVQRAMAALERKGVLVRVERSRWEFEAPALREWILAAR